VDATTVGREGVDVQQTTDPVAGAQRDTSRSSYSEIPDLSEASGACLDCARPRGLPVAGGLWLVRGVKGFGRRSGQSYIVHNSRERDEYCMNKIY
jgi:hypothetical protein